jgi:hypothetical protein
VSQSALRFAVSALTLAFVLAWELFGVALFVSSDGDCKSFPWCEGNGSIWPIETAYLSLSVWAAILLLVIFGHYKFQRWIGGPLKVWRAITAGAVLLLFGGLALLSALLAFSAVPREQCNWGSDWAEGYFCSDYANIYWFFSILFFVILIAAFWLIYRRRDLS